MTTLQARTQGAIGGLVDRHYTFASLLIAAAIALALGVAIGFGVSSLGSPPSSASLTSVNGNSTGEPIQGGR